MISLLLNGELMIEGIEQIVLKLDPTAWPAIVSYFFYTPRNYISSRGGVDPGLPPTTKLARNGRFISGGQNRHHE
jgi:hypothetical protein